MGVENSNNGILTYQHLAIRYFSIKLSSASIASEEILRGVITLIARATAWRFVMLAVVGIISILPLAPSGAFATQEQTYFRWQTNFENGDADFTRGTQHYFDGPTSFYRIISDPTNSGRGKVYHATVIGPPPIKNNGRHRPYGSVWFPPLKAGAHRNEFDLWVGSDLQPALESDARGKPWLSIASLFDDRPVKENPNSTWQVSVFLTIKPYPGRPGQYYIRTASGNRVSPSGQILSYGKEGEFVPSAPAFPLDQWIRVRIEVTARREILTFQDGVLASKALLHPDARLGTVGGHWGLYASEELARAVLMNDNIVLEVFR